MTKYRKTWLAAFALALAFLYFCFWPVPVDPVSWDAPEAPGYEGDFAVNTLLSEFDGMNMGDQTGPEGVVVDPQGYVYATTGQGWIMRWAPDSLNGEKWVKLSGRGLGICLGDQNDFWVADAYEGLFHISAEGVLTNRLSEVEGTPLLYVNSVVMGPDGKVFLTDATQRFSAKLDGGTYPASLLDILEHQDTGRVIEFDPSSGSARVLMGGLSFANGIAIDPQGRYLLINETAGYRVWRYWLTGEKKDTSEVIIDNLPGFPDNLSAGRDGRFWLGFASPRNNLVDALANKPFLRKVVQRLPSFVRPKATHYGHVLAISGDGKVLANLQDPSGIYPLTTGASETEDYLYVSSLIAPMLARVKRDQIPYLH